MTAAIALLLGALTISWLVPSLLRRVELTRADPLMLLVVWLLSTVGVLFAVAAGIVLLLVPGHGLGTGVLSAVRGCATAVSHGTTPRVEESAGLLGAVLLLALGLRFGVIITRGARSRAHTRREHLSVLRVSARCEGKSPTTLWLDHDRPLAFSLAGGAGVVVATEGLTRHLCATEVAAVLAHERAHLLGRHHLLIGWVDALAHALPIVPLFRSAPSAVRELVELTADVAAVRQCGVDAVHAALVRVAGHDAPDGALAMAGDAVELRLARLERAKAPAGRAQRALSCGLAAAAAATLPVITGAVTLLAIAAAACPFSSA